MQNDIVDILNKQFDISKTKIRKMIEQGGLKAYTDEGVVTARGGDVIRPPIVISLGKRRFLRII